MRVALTYNEKRERGEAHAEFDTREAIATVAALVARCGHDVVPIDVTGSVPRLVARLARVRPDLVLNLAEGERGAFREAFYPALFEQLGLPHTGSSASTRCSSPHGVDRSSGRPSSSSPTTSTPIASRGSRCWRR